METAICIHYWDIWFPCTYKYCLKVPCHESARCKHTQEQQTGRGSGEESRHTRCSLVVKPWHSGNCAGDFSANWTLEWAGMVALGKNPPKPFFGLDASRRERPFACKGRSTKWGRGSGGESRNKCWSLVAKCCHSGNCAGNFCNERQAKLFIIQLNYRNKHGHQGWYFIVTFPHAVNRFRNL